MKLLYLLIALLPFCPAFGQAPISLQGKVTDKSTGEPLAYATIYLVGTSIGTTANQTGDFVFKIPATAESQIVAVSYVGYQSVRINRHDIIQPYRSISLEPVSVALEEVVVKPIDPLAIVYNSIEKFSRNYASAPYTVDGFQREYVTADRKIIQLLEVAFQTKGTRESQASTVLDARYLEDKQAKSSLWNPSRGGFYTLGWTTVSGIDTPVEQTFLGVTLKKNSDLAKYYDFNFSNTLTLDGRLVYVIDFDQKKAVRKALLKGTLYIDAESGAIVKMMHEVSSRGRPFLRPHETWGGLTISRSPKRITVQQDRWVTTYKQYGTRWYLSSLIIDTEFTAALLFLGIVQARQNSLRLHSERVVTAIDTISASGTSGVTNIDQVGSMPTLQNFIKKEYENYDETKPRNWAMVNFIQLDTSVALLAEQLRLNNQQWEQETRMQAATKLMASGGYTARQLREDVDYLRETLEKLHPGLHRYTTKSSLDQHFDQVRDQLAHTSSGSDFFQQLSPLIETIHCGHTELYPPAMTSVSTHSIQEPHAVSTPLFPLDLWINGDSAFVINDYEGIAKGSSVVSINGHQTADVLRQITANLPADGYNQTYKVFRLQHEFSRLFTRYIQSTDTFEVTIREGNKSVRTLRLVGKGGEDKPIANDYATARINDSLRAMIVTIPSFSTNQDFPAFLTETFAQLANKPTKNLIIDLRNNQGGRDDYGALLYTYLADKPFRYYQRISVGSTDTAMLNRLSFGEMPLTKALPEYLSHVQKRDGLHGYTAHANLAIQQPQPNRFTGRVYILINGGTFSSASEFTAIARSNRRALFIGQETGGGYYGNNSLGTPLLTLPNSKIRLAVPLANYELAVSPDVPAGHGVIPDYPTVYQITDILSNRDKDLEVCFDLIKKAKK